MDVSTKVKRVYSSQEREYRRRYMEEYRKRNPDAVKKWAEKYYADKSRYLHYSRKGALKMKYGISLEDYDRMLVEQEGKCAICQRLPGKYRLAVDHDHRTGKVRKLLCGVCNTRLATFEDTDFREKAEAYIRANP